MAKILDGYTSLLAVALVAGTLSYAQLPSDAPPPSNRMFLDVSFEKKKAFVDDIAMSELEIEGMAGSRVTALEDIGALPLRIAYLIDASGSQRSRTAGDVFASWIETIRSLPLRQEDAACLIAFNRNVSLRQEFTSDRARLLQQLEGIERSGPTSLLDAISIASQELSRQGDTRKAMVVITDGIDSSSKLRMEDAYKEAAKNNVRIYMFLQQHDFPDNSRDMSMHKKQVMRIGGRVFMASDMESTKDPGRQIFDELSHLKRVFVEISGIPEPGYKIAVMRKGVKARHSSGF